MNKFTFGWNAQIPTKNQIREAALCKDETIIKQRAISLMEMK
jgi:hypothetical protein